MRAASETIQLLARASRLATPAGWRRGTGDPLRRIGYSLASTLVARWTWRDWRLGDANYAVPLPSTGGTHRAGGLAVGHFHGGRGSGDLLATCRWITHLAFCTFSCPSTHTSKTCTPGLVTSSSPLPTPSSQSSSTSHICPSLFVQHLL